MSEQGTLNAVNRYIEMINGKGVTNAVNHTETENGDPTHLEHLLWMLNTLKIKVVPGAANGFDVAKYSRWLGFIQGVLICKKMTTVENERNVTRPWFQG